MAEWRERGWVSASDDEGEELAPPSTTSFNSSATTELGQEEAPDFTQDGDHQGAQSKKPETNLNEQAPTELTVAESGNASSCFQTFLDQESNILSGDRVGQEYSLPDNGIEANVHTAAEGEAESSVATRLQQELELGLDVIKEVLSGASDSSSPLSSVRSFATDSQFDTPAAYATREQVESADGLPLRQHSSESADGWPDTLAAAPRVERSGGRNLRQRNAIQVHPYALEGARYQRELLARGLKPLSFSHSSRRDGRSALDSRDIDSRSTTDENEEPASSQPDDARVLKPISSNSVRKRFKLKAPDATASDEELPDLDDILEGQYGGSRAEHALNTIDHSLTNRKITKKKNELAAFQFPHSSAGSRRELERNEDIFQVPLSPPNSRHHTSSQSSDVLPQISAWRSSATRATPIALLTPNISSVPARRGQAPIQANNDSDSQTGETEHPSILSLRDIPEQITHRLSRLQRKMRGVLPASYSLLQNYQKRSAPSRTRSQSLSSNTGDEALGVARRIPPTRRLQDFPSEVSQAIFISDESSSDENTASGIMEHQQTLDPSGRLNGILDSTNGAIEEDDSIDRMVQRRSGPRQPSRLGKKRQRRIRHFVHHSDDDLDGELPHTRIRKKRKLQIRRDPCLRRQRNQVSKNMRRLDLLSAPSYTHLPRIGQPLFLRVAARGVRSGNIRRKGPSRKSLQSVRSADSEELSPRLGGWRNRPTQLNTPTVSAFPGRRLLQPHSTSVRVSSEDIPESTSLAFHKQRQHSFVNYRHISSLTRREPFLMDGVEIDAPDSSYRRIAQLNELPHPFPISIGVPDGDDVAEQDSLMNLPPRLMNRSSGGLLSSAMHTVRARDAQHEDAMQWTPRQRILAAFRDHSNKARWDQMPDRTFTDTARVDSSLELSKLNPLVNAPRPPPITRKARKRSVHQVNSARMQHAWPGLDEQLHGRDTQSAESLSGVVLTGLGSPGSVTTHDFGITPFPEGTQLSPESLTGKGHLISLIRNVVCQPRNLFLSTGETMLVSRPVSGATSFKWGAWNEEVTKEFDVWFEEANIFLNLSDQPNEEFLPSATLPVLDALASLTTYLCSYVSFRGRDSLVQFLESTSSKLPEAIARILILTKRSWQVLAQSILSASCLFLVLVFELTCIAASTSTGSDYQTRFREAYKQLAAGMLEKIFQRGHLENTLDVLTKGGGGSNVGCKYPGAEALILLHHMGKQPSLNIDVWVLITEALGASISAQGGGSMTFDDYDRGWRGVFSSVPLLEFDMAGVSKRKSSPPGWDLVQRLLTRFMSLYLPRRHQASLSTKSYGRLLLRRCLDLVQVWGWQGGHSVIGALFDAYSSNDMGELFGETPDHHFTTPLDLTTNDFVHVSMLASGFHTFLGLSTQTILDCLKPGADPKLSRRVLRSLCARLVPTKSEELLRSRNPHRHAIIALRNRFDLLSVMYCAMPIGMKPSLRLFQSLVNFRNGHREACKTALACWCHLLQHTVNDENATDTDGQQKSPAYAADSLLQLSKWNESMVLDLLSEYASNGQQGLQLMEQWRPETPEPQWILSDVQKPTVELLKETLRACEQNFSICRTERQARLVLNQHALGQILKLFDAKDRAANSVVSLALQIVAAYSQKCVSSTENPTADEESQEYGTWDHFAGMDIDDPDACQQDHESFSYLLHEVQPMLLRLLSNVFGSDVLPDHAILKTMTECWFEVADVLVRSKARSWDDYLGPYSSSSWLSLRDTQQTRQYGVFFLAKVVDSDCGFYESNRLSILDLWISALCRPSALLCWEHTLTSTILFHDSKSELLFNAPFVVRSDDGNKIEIPMVELRDRRRSMIYVVLRNIHRLQTASIMPLEPSITCSKADFLTILRGMEKTMKTAYQDLEPDSSSQIEYRAFVNFIVQQMQVYVADFHKIDPFFTDPATFSVDEHAVTAALKRHSLTIETRGITKAIVLFLYNAGERAAISGDQESLVLQLQNALMDLSQDAVERTENHGTDAALLTSFLEHVIPPYISRAFSEPGYVLARPMLQVLRYIYQNLRCRGDLWEPTVLSRLIPATEAILQSALSALRDSGNQSTSLPHHQENFIYLVELIHAATLRTYEASQSLPELLDVDNVIETILLIKNHILTIERTAAADMDNDLLLDLLDLGPDLDLDPEGELTTTTTTTPYTVPHHHHPSLIRAYAEKELQSALDRTWRRSASVYPANSFSIPTAPSPHHNHCNSRPPPSTTWEIVGVRGAVKAARASAVRAEYPAREVAGVVTATATVTATSGTMGVPRSLAGLEMEVDEGNGAVEGMDVRKVLVVGEFLEDLARLLVDW